MRNEFDLVELITWNDYGESHYQGPIHGAQPNSQAWVNGFDHSREYDPVKDVIQPVRLTILLICSISLPGSQRVLRPGFQDGNLSGYYL